MVLHSDCNCFYASVEMCEHPELRGKRVAVCGSTEDRHGIVLTASYPAKRMGVRTGMANWQARQACPDLIMVPPHYELYLQYSRAVRAIYRRYTDLIEPYGMDENWLTGSSWGKKYYLNRLEFERYVKEHSAGFVSNILYITKR